MSGFCVRKLKFLRIKYTRKLFLLITLIFTLVMFLIPSKKVLDSSKPKVKNKNNIIKIKSLQISSTGRSYGLQKNKNLKYILQWQKNLITDIDGSSIFTDAKCKYTNCFLTNRKDYFGDYTKFDVILFSGWETIKTNNRDLPQLRSTHQKYVFTSMESSDYYPVCSDRFDGYFNWTWTFRLDSEILMGYIVIRDINGNIIGPKQEMHWMKLEDMKPVPHGLRDKLKSKHKFAAWLVSNCLTKGDRLKFVKNLNKELKRRGYYYQVDIYGSCGDRECPSHMFCEDMFEKDYFFYLAFENSFNPDYVTEKLLRALEFNTIPVVYGGANYTRFMPDGIYLSAKELGVKKLAAKMVEIANDFKIFIDFFKWRNHYTYSTRSIQPDSNNFCMFCALLNNETEMQKITIKSTFQEWWDLADAQC